MLKVSIASDVIEDRMTVEIHDSDRLIVEGIVADDKKVVFRAAQLETEYDFENVRKVFLEFIEKMTVTENL